MELLESRKIASRYAKALLEAAMERDALEQVTQSGLRLRHLYLELPDLNGFFANPGIPAAEKRHLVASQFKPGLAPLLSNLLELLLENDRFAVLPEILERFVALVNEKEGITQAEVIVPVAINDKLENQFRSTLERLFGYQRVDLNVKVDPAIIAGAIVKIGDKIIDGSYHGKLEMLRRQVG